MDSIDYFPCTAVMSGRSLRARKRVTGCSAGRLAVCLSMKREHLSLTSEDLSMASVCLSSNDHQIAFFEIFHVNILLKRDLYKGGSLIIILFNIVFSFHLHSGPTDFVIFKFIKY
jgi:hypothetical protein